MDDTLNYLSGFGSYLTSEALPNTLPYGQNNPQRVNHGLYTEQLSGSAFTAPRQHNLRSWLYRIRPSAHHGEFTRLPHPHIQTITQAEPTPPTQMRWQPLPLPTTPTDFLEGWFCFAYQHQNYGYDNAAIYLYACNRSMDKRYFYNADGELLIVPQLGDLNCNTEFGQLNVQPGEIMVIPRGIKFQVLLHADQARGYICENFGAPLRLPELGPIGANGLANPRDFHYPVACYEDCDDHMLLLTKFQGHLWQAELDHSPLDVVAWHGNYAPYKYDLRLFNTINTVSFDHPDPSIFTVLTSQTNTPGVANVDFVIFPERWMVAEHTFRPPYYHRNIMNEYMGLIYGVYDAKETGFIPGGSSLHNCMSAHGPDDKAFTKATETSKLVPEYYHGTLAFMFESSRVWQPTPAALNAEFRDRDYLTCWQGLKKHFVPPI
ncbi:MAG: homogentisate 1,2-dioxygenase [Gammaproteobacteria bacterium]